MNYRLSILIPAFGYAEGVERILKTLLVINRNDFEIIISDDSIDDKVFKTTAKYLDFFQGKLSYQRNIPGLGAVANWNFLLDQATGEFVILLHHDEYPLGKNFTKNISELLDAHQKIDVFLMDCILTTLTQKEVRPHVPLFLKKLIINHFPSYFFKRNIVGPTSCLIVRRSMFPRFDASLRWLVDVDAYFRLRNTTPNWLILKDLKIASTLGRNDSITASIKDNLTQLDRRERVYLSQKFSTADFWLKPQNYLIINRIEAISWMVMRIITRTYYRLNHLRREVSILYFLGKHKNDRS